MGPGIIDTLNQFLDSLHSSSQGGGDEWQGRLSTIRRTLQEKRNAIESSNDPLIEGLSTILTVARTPSESTQPRLHGTPPCNDPPAPVGGNVSQLLELMRNQIDAVAGAQIQALSRQSSITGHYHQGPLGHFESISSSFSPRTSRSESPHLSESGPLHDARFAEENRSHESSQTDPVIVEMVTIAPKETTEKPSTNDKDDAAETDVGIPEPESPQPSAAVMGFYRPLSAVKENMTMINIYVVAVEMIRASVRNLLTQRDLLNYRAIDPSIHGTPAGAGVDFSIQILAPNDSKQFHVNFGDVIRLKRVNAQLVVDKAGNRHINIIMSLKNHPSMRVWPNVNCYAKQASVSDDGMEDVSSQNDKEKRDIMRLESEAQVIYGGNKTGVEQEDLTIISSMRKWVSEKLDAMEMTTNPDFVISISGAGPFASDFIVCVLEVAPEPDVHLVVSDVSSVAVVMGLNDILIANLLESNNRIQPGEWVKLRYMQRAPQPFQRADGSSHVVLKACNFSCVTRLPQCNLPYMKPIPPNSSRSKRARRMTRMKMWNSASGLNKSFPRHLFGSTGFVDRLLQYNCDDENEFEKVTRSVDEEAEEGEIQAGPQT